MSEIREDAYKKGPLLIKIEACPKTTKAGPCTEECTKECQKKSYTIFDPKSPRKSRKTSKTLQPQILEVIELPETSLARPQTHPVEIIEAPRASIESSSCSHGDSVKTANSGYVLKSTGPSALGSLGRNKMSPIYSKVSTPTTLPPVDIIEAPRASIESSSSSHGDNVKTANSGYVLKSTGPSALGSFGGNKMSPIYSKVSTPTALPSVEIIEAPRASIGSNGGNVKIANSEYVLKSPGPSPVGSLKSHTESSINSTVFLPPTLPPVLSVKEKGDEDSKASFKKTKSSIEDSETSVNESESFIKTSEPKCGVYMKEKKIHPSTSVHSETQLEKHPNLGCILEVLILERHGEDCLSWRPPGETRDWFKDYNIISHHAIPICQGHPSPDLYLPRKPFHCVCEKATNVSKFSSCPVCSRCAFHGRQMKSGHVSDIESEPMATFEPQNLGDLSEHVTFMESGSSNSSRYDYVPDFKSMSTDRQREQRKYPFFVKYFGKKKKKSEVKADKDEKNDSV